MDMRTTAEKHLTTLQNVLHRLMLRYQQRVPSVERILQVMLNEGIISFPSDIENDHIAFRTMGVASLGIQSLEKIFLHYGYQKRDFYYFAEKKRIISKTHGKEPWRPNSLAGMALVWQDRRAGNG